METRADERIRARDYVKSVLYVAGTGAFALLLGLTFVSFSIALLLDRGSPLGTGVVSRNHWMTATALAMILSTACCGFIQGAALRRSLSVLTVPIGWMLVAAIWWAALPLRSLNDALLSAVVPPSLASLAARRGDLYSITKRGRHVVWLLALCTLLVLLVLYNEALWNLLPSSLRVYLW